MPLVHCGSNVGWIASGTSRSWAAANTGSWSGWPSGRPSWVNGATYPPRAPCADGALELRGGGGGVAQRQVRGRDEARPAGAELADPAVVRAWCRPGTASASSHLGLPQQPDRGVEDRRCRCARRRAASRRSSGPSSRTAPRGGRCAPGPSASSARSGAPIAPSVDGKPRAAHHRALAVDLQLLEARSRRPRCAVPDRGTAARCRSPTDPVARGCGRRRRRHRRTTAACVACMGFGMSIERTLCALARPDRMGSSPWTSTSRQTSRQRSTRSTPSSTARSSRSSSRTTTSASSITAASTRAPTSRTAASRRTTGRRCSGRDAPPRRRRRLAAPRSARRVRRPRREQPGDGDHPRALRHEGARPAQRLAERTRSWATSRRC